MHSPFEQVAYTWTFDRDDDLLEESKTAFTDVLVDTDHRCLYFMSGVPHNRYA